MDISKELYELLQSYVCDDEKPDDEVKAEVTTNKKSYPKKQGKRKTGLAYRREQKVKKHDRLMRLINLGYYNPAMGYVDWNLVDGEWQLGNHIKYPKNSNRQRFYKNQSNRRVRRYRGSLPLKGNTYRKLYEYWWEIY